MTFEDTDFRQETLDLDNPFDVKLVKDFLFSLGFEFDPSEVECTMIVYNLKGEIVGTGSHKGRILKYVAVAPKFRDTTAFALIVTYMTEKLLKIYKHTFVFTRPENSVRFCGLGYTLIATAEPLERRNSAHVGRRTRRCADVPLRVRIFQSTQAAGILSLARRNGRMGARRPIRRVSRLGQTSRFLRENALGHGPIDAPVSGQNDASLLDRSRSRQRAYRLEGPRQRH